MDTVDAIYKPGTNENPLQGTGHSLSALWWPERGDLERRAYAHAQLINSAGQRKLTLSSSWTPIKALKNDKNKGEKTHMLVSGYLSEIDYFLLPLLSLCLCDSGLLAAPSIRHSSGFLHLLSPPPETLAPDQLPHWSLVCFLTSSRALFKHFLIRQTLPITQYKRARNNDNESYHYFPSLTTWHMYLFENFQSLITRI